MRSFAIDSSGCWIWTRHRYVATGYGQFCLNGKPGTAHRASHELFKGPIPPGLTIDHLCRVRACVNPAHLEAVTIQENIKRARRDACKQGHPYDEFVKLVGFKRVRRNCRICLAANKARENVTRRARRQAARVTA